MKVSYVYSTEHKIDNAVLNRMLLLSEDGNVLMSAEFVGMTSTGFNRIVITGGGSRFEVPREDLKAFIKILTELDKALPDNI